MCCPTRWSCSGRSAQWHRVRCPDRSRRLRTRPDLLRCAFTGRPPWPGRVVVVARSRRVSDTWVAVLSGGLSHEREVSLRSGRRLSAALRSAGLTVDEWDADANLVGRLRDARRPDAVIVALHGGEGENGAVQNVLEMLLVPYVGTDPRACRRAWDKPTAKAELARVGLATPDWVVLPHSTFRDLGAQAVLDALVDRIGLPLILKPDQGGSALGTQVVREASELPSAMVGCLAYGDTVLAEQYVDGVEVAIGVLEGPSGPEALPAVEIISPA